MKIKFSVLKSLLILLFTSSSGIYADLRDTVVAKVGEEVITLRQLRQNYEFGFSGLKKGNTGRERLINYLNLMINEKLLALHARELGLDKSEEFYDFRDKMLSALLIEYFIEKDIKANISVTEKEIKDAINKDKVSFKFKFWAETEYSKALIVRNSILNKGFDGTVESIVKLSDLGDIYVSGYETDYMKWSDLPAELFDALKNLKTGDISEPVFFDGKYFLLEVTDIKRESFLETEYLSQAPTYRKIILNEKLKKAVLAFVSDLMSEKQIVTRREAFNLLHAGFLEWISLYDRRDISFKKAVEISEVSTPNLYELKTRSKEIIVKNSEGGIDFQTLIPMLRTDRIYFGNYDSIVSKEVLNNEIMLSLRDYYLVGEAKKKDYESQLWVKTNLDDWIDKRLYDEVKTYYLREIKVTESEVMELIVQNTKNHDSYEYEDKVYEKNKQYVIRNLINKKLSEKLLTSTEKLKGIFKTEINYEALNAIQTVEFSKSRWAGVQLFKGGTGRLAFPIVDPFWIL